MASKVSTASFAARSVRANVIGPDVRRRASGSRRRNAFRSRSSTDQTAGDLSEVADASPEITTEDLARDLEAVASKREVRTESELVADLLRRVERIERHLGIASTDFDDE
jgi:hypothetical protein